MERGMTYTTTNSTVYATLNEAIAAGKKEYSVAQNKAHQIAIAVCEVPASIGYFMETLPLGYPRPAGYTIVCRNNGRQWAEIKSGIEQVLGY
jgi:hypothetical protein